MTEKPFEEKEVLEEEKEMPVEEVEEVEEDEVDESEKPSESFLTKRVSTLIGGIAIGGVTLLFLLVLLIMYLAN